MSDQQLNVLIQVLEAQRNAAFTALARTEMALLIANAKIKALTQPNAPEAPEAPKVPAKENQ